MSSSLSFDEARLYLDTINFDFVILQLTKNGWQKQEVLEAIELYKRFLLLVKKYGEKHPIVPSFDIDEIWHTHILNTEKYHQDCEKIFGKYLHHQQPIRKAVEKDSGKFFDKTQQLYYKEYGEYILEIKSKYFLSRLINYFTKF